MPTNLLSTYGRTGRIAAVCAAELSSLSSPVERLKPSRTPPRGHPGKPPRIAGANRRRALRLAHPAMVRMDRHLAVAGAIAASAAAMPSPVARAIAAAISATLAFAASIHAWGATNSGSAASIRCLGDKSPICPRY